MRQVAAVLASIWSLFVDDAWFATFMVGWLALIYLLALAGVDSGWHGALLFGGLGVILMHGASRKSRSR
jgi:hypothetical protein